MDYTKMSRCAGRALLIVLTLGLSPGLAAQEGKVDQVIDTGVQRNEEARASQQRIDQIADSTEKLVSQYKRELKVIDGLKVYNALLQKQLDDQTMELQNLRTSIEEVAVIQRQITPLMLRMLEALGQFIDMDVPFELEKRRGHVETLKATLERSDVTAAEKFRAVVEAYQIENEYGRTISAYKGEVEVTPGQKQQVDFLRIGRVALLYQSVSGQHNGYWDQAERRFVPLEEAEYRNYISKGLQIARKQVAPDLITIPVPAGGAQ